MTWAIEFEEPYDAWDVTTDIEEDVEIRLTVLEFMDHWRTSGPPDDADYDADRDTFSCAVPGTPIIAEYVPAPYTDPPTIIVKRFS